MIARASKLFLPTLREPPADAEAPRTSCSCAAASSARSGRRLWAAAARLARHMRIEQIIREEINAIGGQEMRAPTLTPASSGRRPAASTSRSSST
jgi:Prolyl-tRNA synthetase